MTEPEKSERVSPVTQESYAATAIPSTEDMDTGLQFEPIGHNAEDIALWFRIQQFFTDEAYLLDENQFEQWVDLFTDDVTYWMPVVGNRVMPDLDKATHPFGDLAHFEENKATLAGRVRRLRTGLAWAESPPSRTRHLISNVKVSRISAPKSQTNELLVRSAFLLYRTHMEYDEDVIGGCRTDILRADGDSFKIAHRKIQLDQAVLLAKNLALFF